MNPSLTRSASPARRIAFYLALGAVIAAVIYLMTGSWAQGIVFQPLAYPGGQWDHGDPAIEDAWFESPDGSRLHGWYSAAPSPRAVVLYCHGNGGNITNRLDILQHFRDELHCTFLVFDYRGYGRSNGSPSELGTYADARAARKWLAAKAGVPESDIVLLGSSLGGAVAVDLAANDGARGLILENTFSTLRDVACHKFPRWFVNLACPYDFDSLGKIARYRGPLLQTHGTLDPVIPFSLGERLHAAANEPKTFVPIEKGGHNDPAAPAYREALIAFFAKLAAVAPGKVE